MFSLQRIRITADQSRFGGIVFECSLQNRQNRQATLISQEYELWLTKDMNGGQTQFLWRLSFDLTSISTDTATFIPQSARGLNLIWHFTPSQLQKIEDSREGREAHFELRSRLFAYLQYCTVDGKPHGDPHYAEGCAYAPDTNGYPIRFKIDHTTWAGNLDEIGFRHIILHELSIQTFPPAFGQAEPTVH
jgi:hypothetical protein